MAEIKSVNYSEMKEQISEIWKKGGEIQFAMIDVCKAMEGVSEFWTGNRCNEFLKVWNDQLNPLVAYSKILEFDLPVFLGHIMQSYSELDGAKIGANGYGWGDGLNEIPLTDASTLKFLTGEAESFQQTIGSKFKVSTSAIDEILDKVKTISWQSTSSEVFLSTFEKISMDAKNAIEETQNTLVTKISETKAEVESVESSNTKKAESFGKMD